MTATFKRERAAWRVMKRRCLEVTFKDCPRYGGAGIKVCPQWAQSFQRFLADMGPAPSADSWLGRRHVTQSYTPENTIWTTQPEQERRRKFCRLVTVNGKTMTAAEAGRLPGLPSRNSVLRRIASGFSLEAPKLPKLYRASTWITYQGECLPLPAWARRIGLPHSLLWSRIKRGMSVERALTPYRFSQSTKEKSP